MERYPLSLLCVMLICGTLFLAAPMLHAQAQPQAFSGQEKTEPMSQPEASPPEKREVRTYTLSPEKYEKAVAYSRAKYRLFFIGFAYGLLVLLMILALKVAPRFRNWAEAVSRRRLVQAIIFIPLLLLTNDVLSLPLAVYGQHLALQYDQSVQSWGSWFWDWTKGTLIGLVIGTFLIWILYGVIRRSPRWWWFLFWLVALPIIIFLLFITPIVIEPLFFKFEPLEAKQPGLVTEIEKVVARGGLSIPRERMFEMKASEKLKSVNAYVTGFGATKRVVVWDTTLEKMTPPQTLFVFGHEMGHYVLNHVPVRIAWVAGALLVTLFLGYHSMRWLINRWGERWNIRGVDDWASLPALMLFLSLFSFLLFPILNSFSRYQEHQADIYGLEVVHGIVPDAGRAGAEAFQILGEINLADPAPPAFIKFWLYDHPPLDERIKFAHEYDPWSKGQPTQYVR